MSYSRLNFQKVFRTAELQRAIFRIIIAIGYGQSFNHSQDAEGRASGLADKVTSRLGLDCWLSFGRHDSAKLNVLGAF
jgi:hypothetical protein